MRLGVSWVSCGVLGYPGVSWGNQTDPELRYAHHDSRFLNLHRIIRVFSLRYSNLFRNNLIGYTVSFRIMTSTIRKERKKKKRAVQNVTKCDYIFDCVSYYFLNLQV